MLYQNLDKGDSVNLTYQYFDDEVFFTRNEIF